jgi:glycosyltransferase involved in cell wall biosynthesis
MRISIVTPSYNQAQFIRYALDSIHSQGYPDLEHIVMDGGSTDGTVDILRSYDKGDIIWLSEPDSGQSDAINKGMRRTTGDILAYLNSDDALLPGSLTFVAAYFEQHPDIDVLYGAVETTDADHNVISRELQPSTLDWWTVMTKRMVLPQQGIFWRRRVYEALGDFDETLHYRMDYDFWMRSLLAGFNWGRTEQFLGQFRIHDTSKSGSQDINFAADWWTILSRIYARDDLPLEVLELKETAYSYAEFYAGRSYFYAKDYRQARSYLMRFLRGKARTRQKTLAALMYLDALVGLPLLMSVATMVYRPLRT